MQELIITVTDERGNLCEINMFTKEYEKKLLVMTTTKNNKSTSITMQENDAKQIISFLQNYYNL